MTVAPTKRRAADGAGRTMQWHRAMCCIAAVNVQLWCVAARTTDTTRSWYAAWHLALSAVFTAVCAFRSAVPRVDLERYCLFDSAASSMALGRAAATVAEVSFGCQVALLLHEAGTAAGVPWVAVYVAPFVAAALTLANCFCWGGVITLNNVYHAIEEAIWALTFAVFGVSLAICGIASGELLWQRVAIVGVALSAVYVAFMVLVDVPMYVARWREECAVLADPKASAAAKASVKRLGVAEGFVDAVQRRVVTREWAVWHTEWPWMTGYFSAAVWVSIGLATLPR
jgi:hypothetical protein